MAEETHTTVPKPSKRHNSHHMNSDSKSLRQQVFGLLDKNPLLTAKPLCKLMELNYRDYGCYVQNLRSQWKYHYKNRLGLKCLKSHRVRGWVVVEGWVDRGRAVGVGWRGTRARNRMLVWRDGLGRLEWFETGRVNFVVRAPASLGRVKQLLCNGFAWTGLIEDNAAMAKVLDGVRLKGAHDVYPTAQRLPTMRITKYARSNGVIIKVGDRTHPHAVEVEFTYPDWGERLEELLKSLVDLVAPKASMVHVVRRSDLSHVS